MVVYQSESGATVVHPMAVLGRLVRIENCFVVPPGRQAEFQRGIDAAFVALLACFALFFHPDETVQLWASGGYLLTCMAIGLFFNTRFTIGKARDFPPRTANRRASVQWLAMMAMCVAAPFV